MRISIVLACLILVPAVGASQGAPGTNLIVDVRVTTVSLHGDTTAVTFVLSNEASSVERLFRFMVDAPSPALQVSRPENTGWNTGVTFGARSVAVWAALGQRMLPGQESPPLTFKALGLPAIVTGWIRGYTPPSAVIPSDTIPLSEPAMVADSTVGVEPFPLDRGAANLLTRLDGLLNQTCGSLDWITSSTVCSTLGARLDTASQAVSQGNTAGARTAVQGFLSDVEAQHGTGLPVNDSAYWLLKVNAEYILTRL